MANFGFTDNDGVDVGEKYVTKEYAIDVYPNIFTNATMAGLYTWGGGAVLGINATSSRSSPGTTSGAGTNWRMVQAGDTTGIALKGDGTLWTWGSATYGTLGNASTIVGRSSPGTTSGGGTDWAALALCCQATHHMAIKTNGLLYSWGQGSSGQLGSSGTANRSSPVTVVGGITDWVTCSAGAGFSAGIRSTGQLYTWGLGNVGQLGSGATTSRTSPVTTVGGGTNWKIVSCGSGYAAAIKTDGTLWTWGQNPTGQLGDGATSASRSSPNTVSGGGTNWKDVRCGLGYTAAIKTDGTLWTWGTNAAGQLGAGATTASRSSPGTTAGGGTNWVKCAVSSADNMYGIKADGTLWTWGSNASGQLGDGATTASRSSPGTTAGGGTNWKTIAAHLTVGLSIREEDSW